MCHRRLSGASVTLNSVNEKGNGKLNTDTSSDFLWKPRITIESFLVGYHLRMGQDTLEASCLVSMKQGA